MTAAQSTPAPAKYDAPGFSAPIDLDLSRNEGACAIADLAGALASVEPSMLECYPDILPLQRRLARHVGLDPDRVVVTTGGDEGIDRAIRVAIRSGRTRVLGHDPSFEMIGVSTVNAGATLDTISWLEGAFPVDAFCAAIDASVAAVVLVTPNNPTGAAIDLPDIRRVVDRAAEVGAMALIDLAYVEFAADDPTHTLLEMPNVVIVRTLSKAWGLAGLRIGYLLASEELSDTLRNAGGPFPVSGVSLHLAEKALDAGGIDIDGFQRRKARLGAIVGSIGGRPWASDANFVLAQVPDAAWLRDALASLGIAVRRFPSSPELADCLRITVPTNDAALDRLESALRIVSAPQAVLFDMDGVLAEVSTSYRRAIVKTARHFGVEVTPVEIGEAKRRGGANNDWELTDRLLAAAGVDVPFDQIRSVFESVYHGTEAQPGLKMTESLLVDPSDLRSLATRYPLAIVTGRPRADALEFLDRFDIRDVFEVIISMEDGPAKPDPAPVHRAMEALRVERAWMIGDTVDDINASRAAGVLPIGVVPRGDAFDETYAALMNAGSAVAYETTEQCMERLPS
ncbi:MAG: TIGR01548 family HAD-type hydrolase [Planctomycetota bacterium]